MKKLFAISTIFLFLLSFGVVALSLPHPIAGKILVGGVPADAELRITNLGTGDSQLAQTNENGEYIVDLANFPNEYRNVDKIKVEVVNCYAANCGLEFYLSGGSNIASFDLNVGQVSPVQTITTTITKYQCSDGTIKDAIADCPVGTVYVNTTQIIEYRNIVINNITTFKETKYVCSDKSIVDKAEDCPDTIIGGMDLSTALLVGLIGIAAAVLGIFGWGKGYTKMAMSYKKKGDICLKAGDKEGANKNYIRAAKMLKTTLENVKKGKYEK